MTTKVEKTIDVAVPVSTAYNQWTQFEEFPMFMGGVQEVRQLNDRTLHWIAKISGVKREWDATILEQTPDRKIRGRRPPARPMPALCSSSLSARTGRRFG